MSGPRVTPQEEGDTEVLKGGVDISGEQLPDMKWGPAPPYCTFHLRILAPWREAGGTVLCVLRHVWQGSCPSCPHF